MLSYEQEQMMLEREIDISHDYVADLRYHMMKMKMSKQEIDYALAPILDMIREKEAKLNSLNSRHRFSLLE